MAKHRSDPRSRELLEQMDDTRQGLVYVIDDLRGRGVTRNEIAAAAAWNPGYLSEVLGNAQKRPTVEKTIGLIEVLVTFCRLRGQSPQAGESLRRIAERYRVPLEPLVNPASGPISSAAENYVVRGYLHSAIERRLVHPGVYAIDGPPMSGVSTTLSFVARALRERGVHVARVDAKTDLSSKMIERSNSRILGALTAAIIGSSDLLDQEYYEVQHALRRHLAAATPETAVLIDNANHLAADQQSALSQLLRDWQGRRANEEDGFSHTTCWLAYSWRFESIRDVRAHSQLALDYVFTRWLEDAEIAGLARSLERFGGVQGTIEPGAAWAARVASSAREYFNGQPHLTHLYMWERLTDGRTATEEILSPEHAPTGAFAVHLRQVARTVIGLIGESAATDLARHLREPTAVELPMVRRSLEDLEIIDLKGSCSNRYYAAHLPGAIERGLAEKADG